MRAVLVIVVIAALVGCDLRDDESPVAAPRETGPRAAQPGNVELALAANYRITTVPPVPSGLYRATGTFTASGAVADSGTALLVYRITGRGPDAVRGEETLRGRRGTVVVRFEAEAVPIGERSINERPGPMGIFGVGRSRVDRGLRAYAGFGGRIGTIAYTIDFRKRTASSEHTLGP